MGYYVAKGFAFPKSNRFMAIELTDNNTTRLQTSRVSATVLATIFPFPLRYKLVWQLKSSKPVFAWKAVPPDGFVALGMISTVVEDPPDLNAMRCVPQAWCAASKIAPRKVWDDSGAGGGKAGSVWVINSMDMIAFVAGHEAPKEPFFDLKSSRFFTSQFAKCGANGEVKFI
jgi:hypothetical protein